MLQYCNKKHFSCGRGVRLTLHGEPHTATSILQKASAKTETVKNKGFYCSRKKAGMCYSGKWKTNLLINYFVLYEWQWWRFLPVGKSINLYRCSRMFCLFVMSRTNKLRTITSCRAWAMALCCTHLCHSQTLYGVYFIDYKKARNVCKNKRKVHSGQHVLSTYCYYYLGEHRWGVWNVLSSTMRKGSK